MNAKTVTPTPVEQQQFGATLAPSSSLKLAAAIGRLASKNFSPLLKQLPTIGIYLIAVTLMLTVSAVKVTSVPTVLASGLVLVIATIVALVLSLNKSRWHLIVIVAAIDLVAVVLLRYGTDTNTSVFSTFSLAMLIWFCLETGQRFAWLGLIGAALTIADAAFEFLLNPDRLTPASEYVKDAFGLVVLCFVFGAITMKFLQEAHVHQQKSALIAELQEQRRLADIRLHAEEMAKSEALVRASDRLIRQLWEASTHQCSIGTDATGLINAWNSGAVWLLGLTSEQTIGIRHVKDFLFPVEAAGLASFAALVEPALLGPSEIREWTYVRDDGTPVAVELSVTARVDDDGETVGYLFVANNLTKANEASRLKDEFVALISHELRTPLTSILGYLELMRDDGDVELSEQQLEFLSVAERNAHRLLRLVGDLMFAAQVESGSFSLDKREQSLVPILESSVESARLAAFEAGITLSLDAVGDHPVHVDAVRLGQACDNLISNAIKFTHSGGTVTVTLNDDQSNAVISVTDTGVGIAADDLDKLFSRFFRTSTATQNAVQGVGLGLVITRAIAVAHGGKIAVSSEVGVGTRFSMTVPLLLHAMV